MSCCALWSDDSRCCVLPPQTARGFNVVWLLYFLYLQKPGMDVADGYVTFMRHSQDMLRDKVNEEVYIGRLFDVSMLLTGGLQGVQWGPHWGAIGGSARHWGGYRVQELLRTARPQGLWRTSFLIYQWLPLGPIENVNTEKDIPSTFKATVGNLEKWFRVS